jgi:hypothetical protein
MFLDYNVTTFQIRGGSSQSYTIPNRCLITVGFVRPDNDDFPTVRLRTFGGIEGVNGMDIFLLNGISGDFDDSYLQTNLIGSVVAKAGSVLVMDGDECDIEIHFLRLPEVT